jgi:hypothetical protein
MIIMTLAKHQLHTQSIQTVPFILSPSMVALSHRKHHPPGHTVAAVVLRDTIKRTFVLQFRTSQLLWDHGSNYFGGEISRSVRTGPEAHPAFCTIAIRSCQGVKRPGRGADHPPPSSVGLKSSRIYTSISPLRLHRHVLS